jgi:carboxynorspermidine decarboxylase
MMFDAFERYAEGLNELDPRLLKGIKTLNIGGGQHFTAEDYDTETAISLINRLQEKYNLQIIAEPGEAVALNAGYLVASVMDIVENDIEIAILDTSAACHMPDVLEMPYTPPVFGAYSPVVAYAENINAELLREDIPDIGNNVQKNSPQNPEKNLENSSFSSPETLRKLHPYRLAGNTCLAGDVIGDYAFEDVLQVGSRVVFGDMAIYSMVKTNTFNGINLPDIAVLENGEIKVLKSFSYQDFENRL